MWSESWLLLLTSLTAVVWPAVALGVYCSFRRCRAVIPADRASVGHEEPVLMSVIIPARNEEQNIERTVRDVLAQYGVAVEVIAIDDHSTDRTGAILDELAREDPRLVVLHQPPSREGWLGKANAIRHGVRLATGPYFVFTDADVRHHPGTFLAALRAVRAQRLALLSLLPRFEWNSLWENAAAPAFLLVFANFLSGRIHEPESEDALAIGAFIMVDAGVYRALGGHAAVREDMLDDLGLAQYFKASGERVAFQVAPRCLRVRMYNDARAVFSGALKSCLPLFGRSIWPAAPLALTFAVGSITVLSAPLVGLVLGIPELFLLGILVYSEVWLTVVIARPYMDTNLYKLAGFALGAPLLFAATVLAVYQGVFHGTVLWRGRTIRLTT